MAAGAPQSTDPEPPGHARLEAEPERLRDETDTERLDRNLIELLQEVRVVQTGVQVLFAFLLTAPLAARFTELTRFQRWDYFVTLLATGAAAILLIAPTAYHRILFRCGDKEYLVQVANRFTLAGLAFVGISMTGALLLVSDLMFDGAIVAATVALPALGCVAFWCLMPLSRKTSLRRQEASPTPVHAAAPTHRAGPG
jgi:hypothetical protein